MVEEYKRQTAYLCTVHQLAEGRFIRRDGWEPSFLVTSVGAVSRARIAAVVTESSSAQLLCDDGSGVIAVRSFDSSLPLLPLGSFVLVIGRPRVFQEKVFLAAECVRALQSSSWLLYYRTHRDDLQKYIPQYEESVSERTEESVSQISNKMISTSPSSTAQTSVLQSSVVLTPVSLTTASLTSLVSSRPPLLIDIIRELDLGDGAPVDEVLKRAGTGAETRLEMLIREGEVFELRAGKVKVLE